jgi:hypothetical protein
MPDLILPAITEHATRFKSGDMVVWDETPETLAVYPLAARIEQKQEGGGKVWVRKVIVVEPWTEVPRA